MPRLFVVRKYERIVSGSEREDLASDCQDLVRSVYHHVVIENLHEQRCASRAEPKRFLYAEVGFRPVACSQKSERQFRPVERRTGILTQQGFITGQDLPRIGRPGNIEKMSNIFLHLRIAETDFAGIALRAMNALGKPKRRPAKER